MLREAVVFLCLSVAAILLVNVVLFFGAVMGAWQ